MKIGRVYANFQEDFLYTEHYIAKELSQNGHETVFITSDKYLSSWNKYLKTKDTAGEYERVHYKIIRLHAFAPFEKVIFKNPFKLWHLLFQSGFDVLHLNAVGSFSTMMVLWMVALKGKMAPPVIVSDHSDTRTHRREGKFANFYYYFFRIQLSFFQRYISKIITFGEIGMQVLGPRFGLPASIFRVIPLGFDQNNYFFQPALKNNEPKMIIGYAGKIDAQKRIDYLVRMIEQVPFKHSIRLEIVGIKKGDPYCEHIAALAKQSDVEILLKPFVAKAELAEFYNHIDLAVYPGGISITTIEANGCGTPVLIYRSITGLESRVVDGRGQLFTTDDEFSTAIYSFFQQYQTKQIDNQRISEVTQAASSWRVIKDFYLSLYQNVQ